jgi:hypothetical protein
MKMEQRECSETSAYNIQTPGNYPVENIQHTEHGESLKSGIIKTVYKTTDTAEINYVGTFSKLSHDDGESSFGRRSSRGRITLKCMLTNEVEKV